MCLQISVSCTYSSDCHDLHLSRGPLSTRMGKGTTVEAGRGVVVGLWDLDPRVGILCRVGEPLTFSDGHGFESVLSLRHVLSSLLRS